MTATLTGRLLAEGYGARRFGRFVRFFGLDVFFALALALVFA
jgi:hypothetical protein